MRQLTVTEQMAIEDLELSCVEQGYSDSRISNMIESMVGLLEKDMITVIRMESGEYFWKSTKIGDPTGVGRCFFLWLTENVDFTMMHLCIPYSTRSDTTWLENF